ncbi:hypothetical protein HDV63DRAFT_262735 [Trichoderma sp. SZMC 28014]
MQSTNSLAVFLHVFSFGYASSVYLIFGLPFSSTLSRLVRQTTRPRRPLRRSRGSIRHRCPPIWACQQRQWPLSSALRLNRVSRNPPVRTALNWVQNNVGEPLRLRPFGTLHRAWAIAGQIRVWLHLIATDSECIRQGHCTAQTATFEACIQHPGRALLALNSGLTSRYIASSCLVAHFLASPRAQVLKGPPAEDESSQSQPCEAAFAVHEAA